jgi:hypothetical protein
MAAPRHSDARSGVGHGCASADSDLHQVKTQGQRVAGTAADVAGIAADTSPHRRTLGGKSCNAAENDARSGDRQEVRQRLIRCNMQWFTDHLRYSIPSHST